MSKREAVQLKELLSQAAKTGSVDVEFFLTSDWYSLESGAPWFTPLVEKLRQCDGLIVIITRPEAFRNPWINFEIGAAFGSDKLPKILFFGGVPWTDIPHPIAGLQLIDTGDTNRWTGDLCALLGVKGITKGLEEKFGYLFKQK